MTTFEQSEYHKISGPFKRHIAGPDKNRLIAWDWAMPEFEFLQDVKWNFTEKIDGTNIRVIWDGYRVEFRGRTNRATIPVKLLDTLTDLFPEELMEQAFGVNQAILYGEGYGAGIQKGGGNYTSENKFILFDVFIGGWWLQRDSVEDIAKSLGLEIVPIRIKITLRRAIEDMAAFDKLYSQVAETPLTIAEGIVGTPAVALYTRRGDRIIVKLKGIDLHGLAL